MSDVVLPARLMKLMGAEVLFLTNAAGGIQLGMNAGDFMLIKDQLASFVPSPLRGANVDELGVRFPDMSQVYDKELQLLVKKAALGLDIDLKEGTYLQLSGPQFETPKEVAMCRTLGADAVGMSTACEAIAARHMGMRVVFPAFPIWHAVSRRFPSAMRKYRRRQTVWHRSSRLL